jgi:hypothetical protein
MTPRLAHLLAQDNANPCSLWGRVQLAFGYCVVCVFGLVQLARAEWKRWRRAK